MKKIRKLIPIVAMVGTIVPMVTITACNKKQDATTYTVTYGSAPTGLTYSTKPETVAKGESLTVTYSIDPGYSISSKNSTIKSGDIEITSSCNFSSTSLTIPASVITSNLSITLATTKNANTYTVSYNKPTGLTWTTQPQTVVENTGVSAEYKLTAGYLIDTDTSKITIGGTDVTSQITYNNGSVNIPSSLVTGNIVITLATKPAPTYNVTYTAHEDIEWSSSNPEKATQGVVFSAGYSIKTAEKVIDDTQCSITANGNEIKDKCTYTNGTVIIPANYVTGVIVITLGTKTQTIDGDYTDLSGGTITASDPSATGVKTYTLKADSTNGEMNITLNKTWGNSSFKIASAGTYNITLNNCVISNSNSTDATAEAPFNIAKGASGAVVNLILPSGSESSINDKRASNVEYEDAFVIRHNSKDGTGSLNIKGSGVLNINNVNSNKGANAKAIQTKTDMTISGGATVNAFAYDTCIQVGGTLTIDNANVVADSYNDDAIKNKALEATEDLSGTVGTLNKNRDIIIKGNSIVKVYAARNGISAAHDFISQGTPTIEAYTGYANAGSKVRSDDKLDEQNMYVAIPESYNPYSGIENYFYTVTFKDSTATLKDTTEVLTLKKIKGDDRLGSLGSNGSTYYYYKCDRPLKAYNQFVINKYTKDQFGASTMTPTATSSTCTISNGTQTSNYDTIKVSSISGTTISTESTSCNANYKQMIGQRSSIDKVVGSKGIKAKNEVKLVAGNITLNTQDTCVSAGYGEIFCNSTTAGDVTFGTGDITITGAAVVGASSSGDGIKAYGKMNVNGGTTTITKSIEALEAGVININGGIIKLSASDDGLNASQIGKYNKSMVSINVSGGVLDVQTTSTQDTDAIDSNNTINITGGLIIARVPDGNPSSALDSEVSPVNMSGATLICLGNVEPSISGPTQTSLSGLSTSGSHKITYYTSNASTSTYTFTNDTTMNSSCKVYYNYKAPTAA